MATLIERVHAIPPERGYHIRGIVWLGYGSNFEEVEREIDIKIAGSDATIFAKAESEHALAEMIANVYNDLDIDEQEPHFLVCHLDRWNVVIEPIN